MVESGTTPSSGRDKVKRNKGAKAHRVKDEKSLNFDLLDYTISMINADKCGTNRGNPLIM